MRVERRCIVNADRDAVWKVVSDPDCYPSFLANLERWETETEGTVGLEARYIVHWKIGSAPVGGTVGVVEFDNARDLAWTAITGMTVRSRFRLRDASPGQDEGEIPAGLSGAGRAARPDR
jgi:carbon monoxide dehydrogenase subunit G